MVVSLMPVFPLNSGSKMSKNPSKVDVRLSCFLVLLTLASAAESRIQDSSTETHENIRQVSSSPTPSALICQPQILKPRINCACFAYKRFYINEEKWAKITHFCQEELNYDIDAGRANCPATDFESAPGSFNFITMSEYFSVAEDLCQHSTPSYSSFSSDEYRIRMLMILHGRYGPYRYPRRYSLSESRNDRTDHEPVVLGGVSDSLNPLPMRIERKIVREGLLALCVTIAALKNLSEAEAYSMCCPDCNESFK